MFCSHLTKLLSAAYGCFEQSYQHQQPHRRCDGEVGKKSGGGGGGDEEIGDDLDGWEAMEAEKIRRGDAMQRD